MRTIRIKLYKFKELSKEAQGTAINDDILRFAVSFKCDPVFNEVSKRRAQEYFIKYKVEFSETGKMFNLL